MLRCLDCRSRISPLAHTHLGNSNINHDELITATWNIVEQGAISAKQLANSPDISYPSALLILRKIRRGLLHAQLAADKLSGNVEVDEAFIGGSKSNTGKRGRSVVPAKYLIFCAVERGESGRCIMRSYDKATKKNLRSFIKDNIQTSSTLYTDGYVGYAGIDTEGYDHISTVIDGGDLAAHEALPVVHQSISLLKRRMLGTYNRQPKLAYLDDYLAEFCFRWNTRSLSVGERFILIWETLLSTNPSGAST